VVADVVGTRALAATNRYRLLAARPASSTGGTDEADRVVEPAASGHQSAGTRGFSALAGRPLTASP
jgi:hypothetical protein